MYLTCGQQCKALPREKGLIRIVVNYTDLFYGNLLLGTWPLYRRDNQLAPDWFSFLNFPLTFLREEPHTIVSPGWRLCYPSYIGFLITDGTVIPSTLEGFFADLKSSYISTLSWHIRHRGSHKFLYNHGARDEKNYVQNKSQITWRSFICSIVKSSHNGTN